MSNFARFNIDTMSGVFPGTRTMIFQRVRLQPVAGDAAPRWVRILWYEAPALCAVELDAGENAGSAATEGVRLLLAEPLTGDLRGRLVEGLAAGGWVLHSCGTCAFWQPQPTTTGDGLPAGACAWHGGAGPAVPPQLAVQSLLAPACRAWQPGEAGPALVRDEGTQGAPPAPIRRRAEQETNERWTLWGQLRRALRPAPVTGTTASGQPNWEEIVVERSGVGAGTEQCFACQGRIANLGALTVATPEGDRQTFSVWRCRNCYTCYLNDWIDRWERTDSLETEETFYRLAPAEALEVLAVVDGIVHAEHPARRHERDAQRRWMLAFLAGCTPLSHQIKQGR